MTIPAEGHRSSTSGAYRLATVASPDGPCPVVVTDQGQWRIADVLPLLVPERDETGLLPILNRWDDACRGLAAFVGGPARTAPRPLNPAALVAPILYPRKVIGIGDNYADHNAGLGKPRVDKTAKRPVFFLKPPTTGVVGPGPVPYPAGVAKLDWEVELAVVIGRTVRRIDPAAAAGAIAGYTIGIDLSARDWQFDPRSPVTPDVFGGKAFDGSCPLGPWIVPSALVPDPQALSLTLAVNGIVRQSGTTGGMIWSVCEQVALISNILTLEPGDVILTGTPAGTGIASGSFLSPGDQIDATIEGIGTLSITIGP